MNVAKLEILEDTFKNKFDIGKFKKFTREFFNEPDMIKKGRRIGIWREYDNHISSYYTIATYVDSQGNKVLVMAVELKRDVSVDRARSMQRNFVSKVLDENNLDAAIVAFYTTNEPSWRLSFVRLDYSFTDKGITLDLTPARRYSYLVGENEPNNTARIQLLPIFEDDKYNPTLDEIENAFSVEKVTKDFFEQYKKKYLDLKEHLENNEEFIDETTKLGFEVHRFSEQFAKKLMGQLAFLYFLQKKGWLGVKIVPKIISKQELFTIYDSVDDTKKKILKKVYLKNKGNKYILNIDLISSKDFTEHEAGLLSDIFVNNEKYNEPWGNGYKQFIRDVLWKHCERHKNNFFNDYLEPFFYNALNTKRKNHYFKEFNSKIPFLNGGLFEPLEGYHWKDIDFEIPNKLFSNKKDRDKEADGILDIFDRFNFTINEDEPLEKEVAIDPEMLGKIFENLLEVKDRKSKGAFYTPREIVHYMCQESLINYLVNEANVPYDDIKEFILYGELIKDADNRRDVGYGKDFTIKQSIFDNIVEIDNALENVRVADPAVGSGAFPLGMLNEIMRARNNITEYIIRKDKEGAFDRRYGEEFIRKWRSPYKMKWETIKSCIFAVDIEPSAVDITKLRLWLSVVIEQEIDDENPEPQPLPNLDMNIHVGNSLIDEYEGIKLFDESILLKSKNRVEENNSEYMGDKSMQIGLFVDPTEELLKRMFELQDRYFDEENEERKREFKADIDKARDELIKHKLYVDGNKKALEKYEESLKNKTKPYFIWELEFARIFKEKGGFDIIIGNPPYVKVQKIEENTVKYFRREFNSATGKFDLYVLFIEKSFRLINLKGVISFIHPHRFIKVGYGSGIRGFLRKNTGLNRFIYFGVEQIFETATTYTGIFFYNFENEFIEHAESDGINLHNLDFNSKEYKFLNDRWDFSSSKGSTIIEKILSQDTNIKKTFQGVYQGLITVGDDIFIMSGDMNKKNLFNGYSKALNSHVIIEGELMKPLLKGEHIKRYSRLSSDIYVFYPHCIFEDGKTKPIEEEVLKVRYPLAYKYIINFKEYLIDKKIKYKTNPQYWYSLHRARDMKIFEQTKIITPQLQNYPHFSLDKNKFYPDAGGYSLILKGNKIDDYKYYLGILNSKLMWYFIKNTSTPFSKGYYYFKTKYLEPFGLPVTINNDIKSEIIAIVNNIIKKKNSSNDVNDVSLLEERLDEIVYRMYNLSDDEIVLLRNF